MIKWHKKHEETLVGIYEENQQVCIVNSENVEVNSNLIVCAPEMRSHLIRLIEIVENEEIIIKDNVDNDGNESIFFKLFKDIISTVKKVR